MARHPLALLLLLSTPLAAAGCRQDPPANAAPAATLAPAASPSTTPPAALRLGDAAALPGGPMAAPSGAPASLFDVGKLPAVVARVNGEAIAKKELVDRAEAMRGQMARMGAAAPPPSEEFYRAMVDQLIGAHLLLAEAERRGLAPTDAEVADGVAQIKRQNPETFARQLAAQGMTETSFGAELAPDLAIRKLVAADVTPSAKVSEEAARSFYQRNLEGMKRPPQVRVRHILVGVQPGAPPEQREATKRKAESLLARVKAGEDFAAVAREASDDPGSRNDGGLLPWLSQGESVPAFERSAFAMRPGQTSELVESPFGFHVLRLEDKRAAATVPFEEARPQIEELLARQHAREMLERKVAALRKAARVEILF